MKSDDCLRRMKKNIYFRVMSSEELKKLLIKNCSEYLTQLKKCKSGNILLRGSFQSISVIQKFEHNINHRKPLHTPIDIHNFVNDFFLDKFGWKIRNGAFCYGFNLNVDERPKELGYGPFFMFFPIGSFKIIYSPTVFDLYGHISTTNTPVDQLVTNMDFKDSTLCSAIESGKRQHENVSNEISVYTNAYFLINFTYKKVILDLIWQS